jgi:3-hydroxyacyl-CoA dehydrogenase
MKHVVTYTIDTDVAVISIANPPVNALSLAVFSGILAALDRAADDDAIRAVVLTGIGRGFSAGADISEFEKPSNAMEISREKNRRCEMLGKPVVAAIHGWALGGGLELALSCHARVATPDARLALPEVKLGIIPGAGGTQRLPRIIGPEAALDMIVTGTAITAADAVGIGLIDGIFECGLLEGAKAYARKLADNGNLPPAARDRKEKLAAARSDPSSFEAHASELLRPVRGLDAPLACVNAVRMALDTPFEEALDKEAAICVRLMNGQQSKAQCHLFLSEREALRVPSLPGGVKPHDIYKAAVVGAGSIGGGIAMSFANAGIPVTILEASQEALERSFDIVRGKYDLSVQRGTLTAQARDQRIALLTGTTQYEDLGHADIIIEAVFGDLVLKKQVFFALDKVAKAGAILASSTSSLDIDEIAASTHRPGDVLGMRFFTPADAMRLIEIVRGGETANDVLATAIAVGKRMGKVPIVVDVHLGDRICTGHVSELATLLEEGVRPEHVDQVFADFGFHMGPSVEALTEKVPSIHRRDVTGEEVIERTIYPMINEGARLLEEGIAARPSHIDIVSVHGYGFPIGKGGPMFWADFEGIEKIVEQLEYWYRQTGRTVFEPTPLLRKLAKTGGSFAGLQAVREMAA